MLLIVTRAFYSSNRYQSIIFKQVSKCFGFDLTYSCSEMSEKHTKEENGLVRSSSSLYYKLLWNSSDLVFKGEVSVVCSVLTLIYCNTLESPDCNGLYVLRCQTSIFSMTSTRINGMI